ncbi:unnamed protein product [Acanthoscelides obtectus]|uniref:Uncharacterized protein n=1 Tax=Acanthoscelides obtectus TaxID=200917 RepID=A0A9P0JVC2_ACAOB|nr:unnamed protein product [Acanthoscelides obtectus]CAK1661781.1 hypothetical protein AOBTE_LOCUS22797 [Acanthoscelides obtectus]
MTVECFGHHHYLEHFKENVETTLLLETVVTLVYNIA